MMFVLRGAGVWTDLAVKNVPGHGLKGGGGWSLRAAIAASLSRAHLV